MDMASLLSIHSSQHTGSGHDISDETVNIDTWEAYILEQHYLTQMSIKGITANSSRVSMEPYESPKQRYIPDIHGRFAWYATSSLGLTIINVLLINDIWVTILNVFTLVMFIISSLIQHQRRQESTSLALRRLWILAFALNVVSQLGTIFWIWYKIHVEHFLQFTTTLISIAQLVLGSYCDVFLALYHISRAWLFVRAGQMKSRQGDEDANKDKWNSILHSFHNRLIRILYFCHSCYQLWLIFNAHFFLDNYGSSIWSVFWVSNVLIIVGGSAYIVIESMKKLKLTYPQQRLNLHASLLDWGGATNLTCSNAYRNAFDFVGMEGLQVIMLLCISFGLISPVIICAIQYLFYTFDNVSTSNVWLETGSYREKNVLNLALIFIIFLSDISHGIIKHTFDKLDIGWKELFTLMMQVISNPAERVTLLWCSFVICGVVWITVLLVNFDRSESDEGKIFTYVLIVLFAMSCVWAMYFFRKKSLRNFTDTAGAISCWWIISIFFGIDAYFSGQKVPFFYVAYALFLMETFIFTAWHLLAKIKKSLVLRRYYKTRLLHWIVVPVQLN